MGGDSFGSPMPLRHRDNAFIPETTGVTFVMSDAGKSDVVCRVEVHALAAAARECGLPDDDKSRIFIDLRRAIEECASDIYDRAGRPVGDVVVVRAGDLLADC